MNEENNCFVTKTETSNESKMSDRQTTTHPELILKTPVQN